jgi:hypothetical protein
MALTPIAKSPYPNVPNLPGVPTLPRSPNFPPAVQAVLGIAEGILWQKLTQGPTWGIYDARGGNSGDVGRCKADSMLSFDFRAESKISDFPVEQGGFATYNKVIMPNESVIRLTRSGTVAERANWLQGIDNVYRSQTLCHVVTPEKVYLNVVIESYDLSRRQGETENRLIVDMRLKEIRQVAVAFSTVKVTANAKNPASVGKANSGQVQPVKPPASLLSQALAAVGVQ